MTVAASQTIGNIYIFSFSLPTTTAAVVVGSLFSLTGTPSSLGLLLVIQSRPVGRIT